MQPTSIPPAATPPPADPRPRALGTGGFARTLAAAIDAPAAPRVGGSQPSTGRLTLGQMLRSLGTGPVGTIGGTAVAPASQPNVSSARVASALRPHTGGDLGVGVVARPVPSAVGSGFGMRRHPIHGDVRMHTGVDLGGAAGDPIGAFAAGTVVFAGPRGGYGNLVIVDHGNGFTTRYAHASRIDVTVGQQVAVGQVLARVGATGTATGPHLHFEIRRDGEAIDPAGYLP